MTQDIWDKALAQTKLARAHYRAGEPEEGDKIISEPVSLMDLGITHEERSNGASGYNHGLWTVGIYANGETGWMEYEGCDAGGLWFENGELTDYDGCYSLSDEVLLILRFLGYAMDECMYA